MSVARLIRAIVAGVVVAGTAAAAHHFAGGCFDAQTLTASAVGFAAIAWPLTVRRIATPQFVGLLLLGQVVVHVYSCCPVPTGPMLSAHVLATAVSALVLRHGERAFWALADLLGLRGLRLTAVTPLATPRLRTAFILRLALDAVLCGGLVTRGPPAALAF